MVDSYTLVCSKCLRQEYEIAFVNGTTICSECLQIERGNILGD